MKMTIRLACIISMLTAAFLQSCALIIPTGIAEQKTWDLAGFDRVVVDSAIDATVSIGTGWSVSTNSDTAVTSYLDLQVIGTTLYVTTLPCTLTGIFILSADVTLPALSSLSASGASTVNLGAVSSTTLTLSSDGASTLNTGAINVQSLTASAAGAATLIMDSLVCSNLVASSAGASHLSVQAGNLGSASLYVTGASDFNATAGLVGSGNVSVNVTGASNADFDTTGTVTGSVLGASNITVGGSPVSLSGIVTDITSHVYQR